MRPVFAFTEPVPVAYPAYVNLGPDRAAQGQYVLIARTRNGAEPSVVSLPREALLGLFHALAQELDGKIG